VTTKEVKKKINEFIHCIMMKDEKMMRKKVEKCI